jgi:curli production assembly/transport component CsgE
MPSFFQRNRKIGSQTRWLLAGLICVLILPIFSQFSYAQDASDENLEIDGLIIDRTKTKLGRDFYQLFYSKWEAPYGIKGYDILISEKPMPGRGSLVQIEVKGTLIFNRRLTPRYAEIEKSAELAIQVTLNYLYNYENYQRQLSGEDMKGSGIY